MTNKEAVMILESIQPSCGEKYSFSESEIYEAIGMAIKALEEPQWIPCSEENPETMPKTNEDVLLQFSSNMGVGFYQDGWAVNTGEGIYSAVDISEEKPIAWMPLPEPWRGDAE